MDLLLEAIDKIEKATKAIKKIGLSNIDPSVKFNQKTVVKEKFKDISQSEALLCILRESSGCMNINDIAGEMFNLKGLPPTERVRHMKALQSIITRTPEAIRANSGRGYWKLKND